MLNFDRKIPHFSKTGFEYVFMFTYDFIFLGRGVAGRGT